MTKKTQNIKIIKSLILKEFESCNFVDKSNFLKKIMIIKKKKIVKKWSKKLLKKFFLIKLIINLR